MRTAESTACDYSARTAAMPQFSDSELTAAVVRSLRSDPDPRAKFLLQELVKSLHDFVRRTDLTFDEWGICHRFPDPHRPEMQRIAGRSSFRLSDVPGASMLVDAVRIIASATARPRPRCSARSMSASTGRRRTAPMSPAILPVERCSCRAASPTSRASRSRRCRSTSGADDDGFYDSPLAGMRPLAELPSDR